MFVLYVWGYCIHTLTTGFLATFVLICEKEREKEREKGKAREREGGGGEREEWSLSVCVTVYTGSHQLWQPSSTCVCVIPGVISFGRHQVLDHGCFFLHVSHTFVVTHVSDCALSNFHFPALFG